MSADTLTGDRLIAAAAELARRVVAEPRRRKSGERLLARALLELTAGAPCDGSCRGESGAHCADPRCPSNR